MKRLFVTLLIALQFVIPAYGYAGEKNPFRVTSLPIPRFASLKNDEAFLRTGPGTIYPIKWVYKRAGLPVQIILEYEMWRKVKMPDGETGWVHHKLLSGKRTVITLGDKPVMAQQKPQIDSGVVYRIEPGVILEFDECRNDWCMVHKDDDKFWVARSAIWGVDPAP